MAYRCDPDLDFLATCSNDDLDILVNYLIGPEGDRRVTEDLTSKAVYKECHPDHVKYWREIAEELQRFGGNTIANLFRGGKGPLYREILCDVCNKMGVNFNKNATIATIELNLLMKVMTDQLARMTPADLESAVKELGIKTTNFTPEAVAIAIQAGIKMSGFYAYELAMVVANGVARTMLGRGLSLGVNAAITRGIGIFAGPLGWAATALWTLIDIAGPAYRVTIPSTIHVAYMRLKTTIA